MHSPAVTNQNKSLSCFELGKLRSDCFLWVTARCTLLLTCALFCEVSLFEIFWRLILFQCWCRFHPKSIYLKKKKILSKSICYTSWSLPIMGSTAWIPHAVPPAGSQRAQPIHSGVMLLYEHRYVLIYGFEAT